MITHFHHRHWVLFVRLAVVALVFAALGTALTPIRLTAYQSTALVSAPLLKRNFLALADQLSNAQAFDIYALHAKNMWLSEPTLQADPLDERLAALRSLIVKAPANWLEPVYDLSRHQLRDLAIDPKKETSPSVIGYRITTTARTPDEARKQTALLADYIADFELRKSLVANFDQAAARHKLLVNTTADHRNAKLQGVQRLENHLKQGNDSGHMVVAGSSLESQQFINFSPMEERYRGLPASFQRAAFEMAIVDGKERMQRDAHQLKQSEVVLSNIKRHSNLIHTPLGEPIATMQPSTDPRAQWPDSTDEFAHRTASHYARNYNDIRSKYIDQPRFIIGPTLPVNPLIAPANITLFFTLIGLAAALAHQFRKRIAQFVRTPFRKVVPNAGR